MSQRKPFPAFEDIFSTIAAMRRRGIFRALVRRFTLLTSDFVSISLAWLLANSLVPPYRDYWYSGGNSHRYQLPLVLMLAIIFSIFSAWKLYQAIGSRRSYLRIAKALSLSSVLQFLVIYFHSPEDFVSQAGVLCFWGLSILFVCTGRFIICLHWKIYPWLPRSPFNERHLGTASTVDFQNLFQPGQLLENRYRIVQLLTDKGGFSRAFEVDDLQAVAGSTTKILKVLTHDHELASFWFEQEARALIRLQHPNIPNVEVDGYFTVPQAGSSKHWHCLVMEKIPGEDLLHWFEARNFEPIDQNLAINWLRQVVEILAVLHKENCFHRDIKPANIMLTPDNRLVLIDFGAVREITNTFLLKHQVGVQTSPVPIISAGYTAPEQEDSKAVPQSDFFSLGRTFVHLLTGAPPHQVRKMSSSKRFVWRAHAPQISEVLADLLDEMMAELPAERPETAEEILKRLEAVEQSYSLP